MSTDFDGKHLRVRTDDQVATLWLDTQGSRTNQFSHDVLADLRAAFLALSKRPVDLLLIRSAKPTGFGGRIDPEELTSLNTATEASWFAQAGQEVFGQLAELNASMQTVAVLEGACLDAGIELALACTHRIAIAQPQTTFQLTMAQHGLLPVWGGTVRLPRLIGIRHALKMLLSGVTVHVPQAARWGLISHILEPKHANIHLRTLLDRWQDQPAAVRAGGRSWLRRLWQDQPLNRRQALREARQTLLTDVPAREQPARHQLVAAVGHAWSQPSEGYARERQALAELLPLSSTRQHLELLHQMRQPIKLYPEPINPIPRLPERIGIVGGGDLGTTLAFHLALAGRTVLLQEAGDERLRTSEARLHRLFAQAVRRGELTLQVAEQANRAIQRTITWQGFDQVGWVMEAVEEDLGIKREVLHALEDRCWPRTPLTSASSTIRIEALQAELQRPQRVAGVHFLAPLASNPIVELVRTPETGSDVVATLDAWLRTLGKTPVLVSDRPGRIVLRLWLVYLSEAVQLVSEGLPPDGIDRRLRRFGMQQGPLEWIDAIGFDRLAGLAEAMHLSRGDRFANNLRLEPLRQVGWQGRVNGEGFYSYQGLRPRRNPLARMLMWQTHETEETIHSHYIFDPLEALREGEERLILRTINEAAACLSEEQVASPATIDLAMAWGAHWAPHRGGPLRYADQIGIGQVVDRLTRFAERFGPRFRPCLELQRRAEAGESFYGLAAEPMAEKTQRARAA